VAASMAASAVTMVRRWVTLSMPFARADVAEPADHMNDEDRRVVEVDQCFH
jgi:hypothetical protein